MGAIDFDEIEGVDGYDDLDDLADIMDIEADMEFANDEFNNDEIH